MEKLRVALVGLGTVSQVHLMCIDLIPEAELVACCDIDPQKKNIRPDLPFYTNVEDMLANEDIDVVHLTLPHFEHSRIAHICAKAGVNVFLEKPVDINFEEAKKLDEDLKHLDKKVKLGICFQNRLNETVIMLKDLVKDQKIKAIKGIVSWYRPFEYFEEKTWRGEKEKAGAGTLINQAIHTLDLMTYITGANWFEVKGKIANLTGFDIEVEDSAMAHIYMQDGTSALYFSTNAYAINDSVEVQVITEDHSYTIKDDKLFDENYNLLEENSEFPGIKMYYGASHLKAIKNFYKAVREDTDNYFDLQSTFQTMALIDAIILSSKEDRSVQKGEFYD